MRRLLACLVLALTACAGGSTATSRAAPTPSFELPSPEAEPAPSPTAAPVAPTVFVIVMENKTYEQALSGPYTARLASLYAVAANYHAVAHPSLPNYLALTSGSTWGVADDGYHRLPAGGLGSQLDAAGLSWKAYMEGMDRGCFRSGYPYALKHNPFAYYGGACPDNVVPFTQLNEDLKSTLPRFVWITPDLCHDDHDCPVSEGDAWLEAVVPVLQETPAYQRGGVIFVTWDEDNGATGNRVATLVISGALKAARSEEPYDHYSLLATVETFFGLPRLGEAARAAPMADLVRLP